MRSKIFTKKRGIIWVALFVSLVFLSRVAYSEERENFKPRLSIKLTGGLVYMNLGDINESLDSHSALGENAKRYWPTSFSFTDEIENIHYGANFEGELIINIVSGFGIGIGIELIHARKESYSIMRGEKSYEYFYTRYTVRESYEQKITVIPIKLGIYYRLPLFPRTALLFNIGGGYYFTKSSLFDDQHRDLYWYIVDIEEHQEVTYAEHTCKVSGGNYGWHGGIGFEWSLSKNFSIIIEGQGRYVKIKELKGKDIMITSWGVKKKFYGTLWYYNYKSDDHYNTSLVLSDRMLEPLRPTDTHRKAILDLSGLSVRIGIRIKLF